MEENSENTDFLEICNNNERYYTFGDFSELNKEKEGEVEEKYLLEDIKKWYILISNVSEKHAKRLLFCLLFIRLLEITRIIVPNWMQSVYYRWKNEKSTVQNLGYKLRTCFQKIFEDYGIGLFSESLPVLDEFPDDILIEILKEADSPSISVKKLYKSLNLEVGTDDLGLYGHDTQLFSLNTLNVAYEELLHYNLDRDERGLIYIKNKQTQRRVRGAYFTPNTFAQFLVKKCLTSRLNKLRSGILRELNDGDFSRAKTLFKQINNLKILDPACGNGVFLTVAYRQIWEFYNRLQKEIEKIGHFSAVSCEFKGIGERILLNNIHGVDNDPQAVELTKLNLWLHLLIFERTRYSYQKEKKKKVKIPPLESNILLFNSIWQPNTSVLTIDQNLKKKLLNIRKTYREKLIESYIKIDIENTDNLRKEAFNLEKELYKTRTTCWNTEIKKIAMSGIEDEEKPIVWPLAFPEAFFRSNSGFDIILTNPPFLAYHSRQTQAISSELLTLYRQLYPTLSQKRPNTYLFFLELCFSYLLKKSGRIGFVVDQAFRDLPAYKHVREFILNKLRIETIVPQIGFPGATVDVSLMVAERPMTSKIIKQSIEWIEAPFDDSSPIILEKTHFSSRPNCEFIFSKEENILRKIEEQPSTPLGGSDGLCNLACGLEYSVLLKKYFLSSFKEDISFHPALDGATDIPSRYTLAWHPNKGSKAYVKFDKNYEKTIISNGWNVGDTGKIVIFASGNESRYKKPKIILRQTCAEFCGIFDDNKGSYGPYYSLRNTHVINLKENKSISLAYILGVLNSQLMSLYGREKNIIRTIGKNRQPQIRVRDLERLPIVLPPISLRKQYFSFFNRYVKRLSALKRTLALLDINYKQQITDKISSEFKVSVPLDDLLNPSNELLEAFQINLLQCRKVEEDKKQIPRQYRIIYANEHTLKVICKNADGTETAITLISFEKTSPKWANDFLFLSLSAKTGRTNYKSKIILRNILKKRFKIPIPQYTEISMFKDVIPNFITNLWIDATKDTKILLRSIYAIIQEANQIEKKIEKIVRALYGIEGDLNEILVKL